MASSGTTSENDAHTGSNLSKFALSLSPQCGRAKPVPTHHLLFTSSVLDLISRRMRLHLFSILALLPSFVSKIIHVTPFPCNLWFTPSSFSHPGSLTSAVSDTCWLPPQHVSSGNTHCHLKYLSITLQAQGNFFFLRTSLQGLREWVNN